MEHYSVIQNSLNDKIVTISCKADTNLFFYQAAGTDNVILFQQIRDYLERWRLIYDSNKAAYKIKSMNIHNTNLVLTWNSPTHNISTQQDSNADNQYWLLLKDIGNNSFIIASYKNPNLVLYADTVAHNLKLSTLNNSNYIKFIIEDYIISDLNNFTCKISPILASNKVVQQVAMTDLNVNLYTWNYGRNQKWTIRYNEEKAAYQFFNEILSNGVLTWIFSNGNTVRVSSNDQNNDAQYWLINPVPDNYRRYTIANLRDKTKVLDLYGGQTADGTAIQVFNSNGGNNQIWNISNP
ncbi:MULTISPECIES: RICIN domain-containing protein [Clostridium]|uniref:Hemagglutinin component HA-33 n=2 Tax=Clostridium TaxID=1485 RepID=A0A1J1CSH2_CLOSG|nr:MULTISPECIES: RICIN domain-containing protein [Clostridium]APF25209.1 hemagglutinin component HA-33 [Clostridium sporogenes]APH16548.1 hemagglutinin component HA-33 [Clostridium sporogenes]MBD5563667.1 ricin-type beta-trefoil lectin domain protein [Clostridium botulinum]MBD5568395.1 ricin-type beta-trefoil lectin domain protein [Clostridium botulinum]MBD5572141.1 ricin-type beta-trefoil lectin domain protein [Clostridium botulinum]